MTTAGLDIRFVDRQPVRVACLRYTGGHGEPLRRFLRGTVAAWLADHGLVDCPRYGITPDGVGRARPGRCRYDAGVEMPSGLSVPDAEETVVAGGTYAVVYFRGTAADIGDAWVGMLDVCRASGKRVDEARAPFEHYPRGAHHDARTGVFVCELCLPVAG